MPESIYKIIKVPLSLRSEILLPEKLWTRQQHCSLHVKNGQVGSPAGIGSSERYDLTYKSHGANVCYQGPENWAGILSNNEPNYCLCAQLPCASVLSNDVKISGRLIDPKILCWVPPLLSQAAPLFPSSPCPARQTSSRFMGKLGVVHRPARCDYVGR